MTHRQVADNLLLVRTICRGLVAAPVESIEGYLLGIPLRVANDIFLKN